MADEVGFRIFSENCGFDMFVGDVFFFAEKTSKHSMLEDDVGIFFFFRCFFCCCIFNFGRNFC